MCSILKFTKKISLTGKEYVNEASFKNHVRLHQQKSSKKENIIPKHDYNPRTPSALGFRKRQSIKPKRFAENVELEDLLKEDIKVSLQKRRKTVMLICDQCQKTFSSRQTLDNHIRQVFFKTLVHMSLTKKTSFFSDCTRMREIFPAQIVTKHLCVNPF